MLEFDLKHHLVSKILTAECLSHEKKIEKNNKNDLIQTKKIFFSFLKS